MKKLIIGLCTFVMLVITPAVHADPITITSGSLTVIGIVGSPTYTLTGENFSVTSTGGDEGNTPNCAPCLSGSPTRVSSFLVGSSLGQGTATINGVTFNNVGFFGTFSLGAADVVLPAGTSNLTVMVPFFFSGTIGGCEGSALICTTQLFSLTELVGQGIATAQFNFIGIHSSGASMYFFDRVTYEFQSAEVPEPMTITLLASGLLGLGAKLRSRRKNQLRS
jgi:hypothetical protein